MNDISDALHFGGIEIRPDQRVVLSAGQPVALGTRAFDVLIVLLSHRDRVVTKNELMERVWPDVVVEENNLQVHVSALRKILGAQSIATIPGRGYRFTLRASDRPAPYRPPAAEMPSLATSDSASMAPSAGRTNPASRQPVLFGRDQELEAVTALVRQHALVTVTGAGGIGKTRLAKAAAASLVDRFADGVWWVELALLVDAASLPAAVARTVGLANLHPPGGVDSVVSRLNGKDALLILDNCEHLVEAVAAFVEALRLAASTVRVLTTSQESLKVSDEHVFRLGSLALPATGIAPSHGAYGAVDLFVARVQSLDPGFAASLERFPLIVEICRRLDGIPLAIEFAAARVPVLGLEGVRRRLDERFQLLTGRSRFVLRRHQTLRAALEWSHGLLSADEQTVLHRLGAFAGSFSLGSAERVAGDERIDRWAVLDHLGCLVDRSLVIAEGDPVPRYRLLETTRAYALEQLAAGGDTAMVLRRHAQSLVEILSIGENKRFALTFPDRAALAVELDNLRAALGWAANAPAAEDRELAVRLAGLSMNVWLFAGWVNEGLNRCLEIEPSVTERTPLRLRALYWRTVARLGNISTRLESLTAAELAADYFRELGDDLYLYEALSSLAASASERGDVDLAGNAVRDATVIERSDFPPRLRASMAWSRQRWLVLQGRDEEALEAVQQQAALYREDGFELGEMIAFGNVAACENRLGRARDAEARARHAVERLVALGGNMHSGHVRFALVDALVLQGRLEEAIVEARGALPMLRSEGDELRLLEPLAQIAALTGRHGDAAILLGFMQAQAEKRGGVLYPVQRRRRQQAASIVRNAVSTDEMNRWQSRGAGLSADEALARGFGDSAPTDRPSAPGV